MADDLRDYGLVPLREVEGLARFARGIPLHRRDGTVRAFAMLDPDDAERLRGFRYFIGAKGNYVMRACGASRTQRLHRDVLGLTAGDRRQGDHINGDRLDNRRSNLRIATNAQNGQNRRPTRRGTSRYRGVCWDKHNGRWMAYARLNHKQYFIGYFDSEDAAGAAASEWRHRHMPYAAD